MEYGAGHSFFTVVESNPTQKTLSQFSSWLFKGGKSLGSPQQLLYS